MRTTPLLFETEGEMPTRFHGTWRLISYHAHHPDGSLTLPLGPDPIGMLIYTSEGKMSGQAMRRTYDPSSTGPLDNYIAYFGSFTVDEAAREIVHLVEGSLYPNWIGTQQRRGFAFSARRLTLTAALKKSGATGTLIWERV